MRGLKKQQGLTLLSTILVLGIVIFFAITAMKLFPVYSEYYSVVQAMDSVAGQPGVQNETPQGIRSAMGRHFDVSYVSSVKSRDIKVGRSNGYKMRVAYEVRKPLFGNLDFVAKFDRTVDLNG